MDHQKRPGVTRGFTPKKGVNPPLPAITILKIGVNPPGGLHLRKGVNPPLRLTFGTQWSKMKKKV